MSRRTKAIVAGWLMMSSAALAQSQPSTGSAGSKVKPLSPYHATASTVEWAEAQEMPSDMPSVVVPRSTPARTMSMQSGSPPAVIPSMASPAPTAGQAPAAMPHGGAGGGNPCQQPSGNWNNSCSQICQQNCSPQNCCQPCNTCCDPCGPDGPCGPAGRFWVGGEYLLWATKSMGLPPLVTSSPLGTPRSAAGVLGDPRTTILYGDQNVNDRFRSGVRLWSGMWLDECQTCGIEGNTFYLQPTGEGARFDCFNNGMIIARPFFNVAPNVLAPDSELVCFPGVLAGDVSVNTRTKLWGTGLAARKNICCGCDYRVDFIGGYRYLQLEDEVTIRENLVVLDAASGFPVGTNIQVLDNFYTKNTFNGGEVGLAGEVRQGRMFIGYRSTIALGSMQKEVQIAGATRITVPGGLPTTTLGGLLTQPTNIGIYNSNSFAVVPEGTINVGYQVTDMLRAYVGYTFLYVSNVSRAGDQIDLVVNTTQLSGGTLVGSPRPAFVRNDTDFWAQGINFGMELRY